MADEKTGKEKRELPPEMVEDVNAIIDERETRKAEEKAENTQKKSWFARYWSDE